MALVIPIGTGAAQADITVATGTPQTIKLIPPTGLSLSPQMAVDMYVLTDGTANYTLYQTISSNNPYFVLIGAGGFRFVRRADSASCGLSVI